MLKGKKILLGITGGIAAYKAVFLIRILKKQGAEVKVIMTPASFDFVTPLTVSTVAQNPVLSSFKSGDDSWNNHVDLALWADVMIVAPATANTLAKMANGICDNLLLATYFSAKCPVYIAPAMDLDMYAHPTVSRNIDQLEKDGVFIIPAEEGELASGLVGKGRMAEPETILDYLTHHFQSDELKGKKVLITAGPTYEAIDPVRFIGNHSSGKMGIELANSFISKGATVELVMGPSALTTSDRIERINVKSADQMFEAVKSRMSDADIVVCAAAVADFKPAEVANHKIKKTEGIPTLSFVENPDILSYVGQNKQNQLVVGFALETNNELENAQSKLKRKNLDLIVLNSLNDPKAGFAKDTNKVTLIDKKLDITSFDVKSKKEVAEDIVQKILKMMNQ